MSQRGVLCCLSLSLSLRITIPLPVQDQQGDKSIGTGVPQTKASSICCGQELAFKNTSLVSSCSPITYSSLKLDEKRDFNH